MNLLPADKRFKYASLLVCLIWMSLVDCGAQDNQTFDDSEIRQTAIVFEKIASDAPRLFPKTVTPAIIATAEAIDRTIPLCLSITEYGPMTIAHYDHYMYKLLTEESFQKSCGLHTDDNVRDILLAFDSARQISSDSAEVFSDDTFVARYDVLRKAVKEYVDVFRNLMADYDGVQSVRLTGRFGYEHWDVYREETPLNEGFLTTFSDLYLDRMAVPFVTETCIHELRPQAAACVYEHGDYIDLRYPHYVEERFRYEISIILTKRASPAQPK